ncbi:hypothetical protein ACTQ40_00180 [Collinsella sp. Sow4_D11]|uniref:hypothetical protein n=1 Tax=Collinsella sp. Sow4_D11 TaxID=3438775 RepID=UPI003F91D94E
MSKADIASIEIDEKKLDQMKYMILEAERNNNNTRARTNDGMIDLITNTIKSVADKTY